MENFSIIIDDKDDSRINFLHAKFFLELCGNAVLEDREAKIEKEENGTEKTRMRIQTRGISIYARPGRSGWKTCADKLPRILLTRKRYWLF